MLEIMKDSRNVSFREISASKELDAVPVQPWWLEQFVGEALYYPRAAIRGSRYRGRFGGCAQNMGPDDWFVKMNPSVKQLSIQSKRPSNCPFKFLWLPCGFLLKHLNTKQKGLPKKRHTHLGMSPYGVHFWLVQREAKRKTTSFGVCFGTTPHLGSVKIGGLKMVKGVLLAQTFHETNKHTHTDTQSSFEMFSESLLRVSLFQDTPLLWAGYF